MGLEVVVVIVVGVVVMVVVVVVVIVVDVVVVVLHGKFEQSQYVSSIPNDFVSELQHTSSQSFGFLIQL